MKRRISSRGTRSGSAGKSVAWGRTVGNTPKEKRPQQHAIPSQAVEETVPYDPLRQPDVAQFQYAQQKIPFGTLADGTFVVSTYDSRPINCIDFRTGNEIREEPFDPFQSQIVRWSYTAPPGRVAVLRGWSLNAAVGRDDGGNLFTPDGQLEGSNSFANIDFLINDAAVTQYSGIRSESIFFGNDSGEVFIIVPELATLTLRVAIQQTGVTFITSEAKLYGNLLLASGSVLPYEIGSQTPVPVKTGFKDGQ